MKKYRHLYFDLDHTLWDFDQNARVTLTEVYAAFELDKKVNAAFDDFYQKYLFHNQVLWDRYHKGFISADDLKWKRMWRTLLDYKVADEPLAKNLSGSFLEILPTQKQVFPHTFEILDYLTAKGYQLHLITNGFEKTQWSKLRNSGLDKYFEHVITSEASNSVKPNKEIFEYALNKAGASLDHSIMIGDNLDADIQGALNAGMDCIFVNHINAVTDIQPTYTVVHLQELENIF
ncbi:MAG: YjjG family noncanonical pyrimidine nucleotidase [Ferruginibacter sp.]